MNELTPNKTAEKIVGKFVDKLFVAETNEKNTFHLIGKDFIYWSQFGRDNPVSKATLASYYRSIKVLNKFIGNKLISLVTMEDVGTIKRDMLDRQLSLGYIELILSFLRSILKFCEEEKGLGVLNYHKIKLPSKPRNNVEYLNGSQLERIFKIVNNVQTIHDLRFKAVFISFLVSGLRISELCSLNRDTIDFETGEGYITGKGNKKRKVFFNEWAIYWIKEYLKARSDDHEALFIAHNNNQPTHRWSDDDIRSKFQLLTKLSGIKARPHMVRKTFATWIRHMGGDIRTIQQLLGHTSTKITELYLGTDESFLKAEHHKFANFGGLQDVGTKVILSKRWERTGRYAECTNCHSNKKRHAGNGLCINCYMQVKYKQKQAV